MEKKYCENLSMADSERFELSVPLRVRILSRDVVSANSPNCPCLWSEIIEEVSLIKYKKEPSPSQD